MIMIMIITIIVRRRYRVAVTGTSAPGFCSRDSDRAHLRREHTLHAIIMEDKSSRKSLQYVASFHRRSISL